MPPAPKRLPCLLPALLVAALVGGCQRAHDPVVEAAIRSATSSLPEAAATGREGGPAAPGHPVRARVAAPLSLPAGFPGDVYLPPRYRINRVLDLKGASVLSLSVPGEVAALFADARARMQAEGWEQTLAAQHASDSAMLAFEKRDGVSLRSATLSFNRNNGDERVIVGVELRSQP